MSIPNIIVRSCAFSGLSNFFFNTRYHSFKFVYGLGCCCLWIKSNIPHVGLELFPGVGKILFHGSWRGSSELYFVGYMPKLNTKILFNFWKKKKLFLNQFLCGHMSVLCGLITPFWQKFWLLFPLCSFKQS